MGKNEMANTPVVDENGVEMMSTKASEREERIVYLFSAGIGTARAAFMNELRKNGSVPAILEPTEQGRVYINNVKGVRVGWVMERSDPNFAVLKSKEPATNTVMDAEELLKVIGKNRVQCLANRFIAGTVSALRLDLNQIEAIDNAGEITVIPDSETSFDLSGFSEENAKRVTTRLQYLQSLEFTPKVMANIASRFTEFLKSHENICEFKPCFENYRSIVENAIMNILAGANLCLSGPKGTGKNKLVEHLSGLFDMSLCDIQLSYDTAKEEVRGEPTIMDDGKIAVRLSNILQAAQSPSIICLDEANMARGSITSLLHSLTDHRRYMEVPGYGVVHVHPQARFVITMNEGDEYEGTREMNSAFRDRFHEIVFEPQVDQMGRVFQKTCGVSEAQAGELLEMYAILFRAVTNPDDSSGIPPEFLSQRAFVRAGNLVAAGFEETVASAVQRCVVDTIPDPTVRGCLETLYSLHKK